MWYIVVNKNTQKEEKKNQKQFLEIYRDTENYKFLRKEPSQKPKPKTPEKPKTTNKKTTQKKKKKPCNC